MTAQFSFPFSFPAKCPVCGKDHAPIECLGKALQLVWTSSKSGLEGVHLSVSPNQKGVVYLIGPPVDLVPCSCPIHKPKPSVRRLPTPGINGTLLTAAETEAAFVERGVWPVCVKCNVPTRAEALLDYVWCPSCRRSMSSCDVAWKVAEKP